MIKPPKKLSREECHINAKAMNSLFWALDKNILKLIYTLPTTYDIWSFLEKSYSRAYADGEQEEFIMDPRERSHTEADAIIKEKSKPAKTQYFQIED